jgi:heme-degrading monooxygenase HmoA
MWIRLGTFFVKSGKLGDLRSIYYRDCAPIVRAFEGNIDCYLMESIDQGERCAVCTTWNTEEDAKSYEASGAAMQVVGMVRMFFASQPLLESFQVSRQ